LENKDARARYGILKGRSGRFALLTRTSVPGGARAAGHQMSNRHRKNREGSNDRSLKTEQ